MKMPDKALEHLVELCADTADLPAPDRAVAAATDIRGRFGDAVAGVLFYGSCLRAGDDDGKILDFYILVDGYRAAYGRFIPALWNHIVPPNVFYAETPAPGGVIRSKYGVISLAQFERLSRAAGDVIVWARFSQPTRLLWSREEQARDRIHRALATAVMTMVGAVAALMPETFSAHEIWQTAFARTYHAELRSERSGRPSDLFTRDADHYRALTAPALHAAGYPVNGPDPAGLYRLAVSKQACRRAKLMWTWRQVSGKILSLARLVTAGFTFAGGADYLAWKIARHSGVKLHLTPWQRRHPVAAGLILFWRLWRQGAFR